MTSEKTRVLAWLCGVLFGCWLLWGYHTDPEIRRLLGEFLRPLPTL